MIRRAVNRLMWLGRATSTVVGLAILFALAIGVTNSALAHTNVDNKLFHLGHSNSTTAPTTLVSTLADALKSALVVQNRSGGPALELRVGNASVPANEVAPMKVNSNKVVTNLNADLVDGQGASSFATQAGLDNEANTRASADTALSDQLNNHNHDAAYVNESDYEDSDVLAKVKNVDGLASGLDADTIDGKNSTEFQSYKRTVVVNPVPNDAVASGTALRSALAGIIGASQSNPFLLKIEPGVYDLGSGPGLQMKQWVDIEGSGQQSTKIRCACGFTEGSQQDAVVKGINNAELRFLTVENTGGGTPGSVSIAILNQIASPRLTHVTATASGGTTRNIGVGTVGSFNSTTSPRMTAVTAAASGGTESYGLYSVAFSLPQMTNVTTTASGAAHNFGAYNNQTATQMTDVTATASGGTNSYGVYNNNAHHNGSSPRMTDVIATASGGTNNNSAVHSAGLSSTQMTDVTATASGGTESYGLYNGSSSSPIIQGSTLKASGASTTNIALSNNGSGAQATQVRNSHLVVPSSAAGGKTIYNGAGWDVKVGASLLEGAGVQNDDPSPDRFTCVASYNGSYAPLDENCTST